VHTSTRLDRVAGPAVATCLLVVRISSLVIAAATRFGLLRTNVGGSIGSNARGHGAVPEKKWEECDGRSGGHSCAKMTPPRRERRR